MRCDILLLIIMYVFFLSLIQRIYPTIVFVSSCRMGHWLHGVQCYQVTGFQWFRRRHGRNRGWKLRDAHRSRKNVMFITIILFNLARTLGFPVWFTTYGTQLFRWKYWTFVWTMEIIIALNFWFMKGMFHEYFLLILWIRLFQCNMICVKNMIYASYSVRENTFSHKQRTRTLFILLPTFTYDI